MNIINDSNPTTPHHTKPHHNHTTPPLAYLKLSESSCGSKPVRSAGKSVDKVKRRKWRARANRHTHTHTNNSGRGSGTQVRSRSRERQKRDSTVCGRERKGRGGPTQQMQQYVHLRLTALCQRAQKTRSLSQCSMAAGERKANEREQRTVVAQL